MFARGVDASFSPGKLLFHLSFPFPGGASRLDFDSASSRRAARREARLSVGCGFPSDEVGASVGTVVPSLREIDPPSPRVPPVLLIHDVRRPEPSSFVPIRNVRCISSKPLEIRKRIVSGGRGANPGPFPSFHPCGTEGSSRIPPFPLVFDAGDPPLYEIAHPGGSFGPGSRRPSVGDPNPEGREGDDLRRSEGARRWMPSSCKTTPPPGNLRPDSMPQRFKTQGRCTSRISPEMSLFDGWQMQRI